MTQCCCGHTELIYDDNEFHRVFHYRSAAHGGFQAAVSWQLPNAGAGQPGRRTLARPLAGWDRQGLGREAGRARPRGRGGDHLRHAAGQAPAAAHLGAVRLQLRPAASPGPQGAQLLLPPGPEAWFPVEATMALSLTPGMSLASDVPLCLASSMWKDWMEEEDFWGHLTRDSLRKRHGKGSSWRFDAGTQGSKHTGENTDE
nr:uncharacterized protein LOC131275267 [Dasypus novemcinctus]